MIYISKSETNIKENLSKSGERLRNSMLSEKAGLETFETSVSESGKPYIKNNSGVCFNISHSGNLVVCAVMCSDVYSEIGIDIELVSDKPRIKAIANRHFTEIELSALTKSGYDLCEFFTTWTRKESYLKCTGQGLSGGLKSANTKNPSVVMNGFMYVFETSTVYDSDKNLYMMSICRPIDEKINFKNF